MYNMFDNDDEFEQNVEQPQLNVQVTYLNIGESDDVVDYLLSDYESDDNEFGLCSYKYGDKVMEVMNVEMKANMYIPSDEPVKFFVGQYFNNFNEFAVALRKFAVHERFKTRKDKFEMTRISVGCEGYGCPWYLYARRTVIQETFMVKQYHNVYTCTRLWKNPECTANELNMMYGVRVNKENLYRGKKIALESGGADFESSYRFIRSYAQMILNNMPDALAIVHVIRLYTLREGFQEGCRPFIGIDGCHLKGPYRGILLSAVALDANTMLSTSTRTWFLGHLKEHMKDSRQLTFMCDRKKRIQNALRLEYPNAHVRYCARHLLANLKSKHPITDFKGGFWEAARASNQIDFEIVMEKVKSADVATYETLRRVHPRFCSRHAFDRTSKSDHCTNNMTESFNA
ncbi:SWIM-type domain-containing protein [Citrus sinensis]|uniref:SWIM-type domain-containing protein n=1 Tax=Citrus sinensis TaxID=2711 RepID=A0ACB8M792_CITSI|nr:SWIM-type domain-containing protein [Citrus sinensis]